MDTKRILLDIACLLFCLGNVNISYCLAYYSPTATSSGTVAQQQQQQEQTSRRTFFKGVASLTTGLAVGLQNSASVANAADLEENVYFGVGCFWHIQHEFAVAERDRLGRKDVELTSLTGYAGGLKTDDQGRVCYHNSRSIADYGKYGHGEVVGMTLPQSKIDEFGKLYFSLFDPKTKNRVDKMDRGGEYRSLIGLPGGVNHPEYRKIEAAAADAGYTLKQGKGNDPDTIDQALVYVYDTAKFPFYQAEVYHQFHNDFLSPPYGKAYNSIADLLVENGRIKVTGCPDRI